MHELEVCNDTSFSKYCSVVILNVVDEPTTCRCINILYLRVLVIIIRIWNLTQWFKLKRYVMFVQPKHLRIYPQCCWVELSCLSFFTNWPLSYSMNVTLFNLNRYENQCCYGVPIWSTYTGVKYDHFVSLAKPGRYLSNKGQNKHMTIEIYENIITSDTDLS